MLEVTSDDIAALNDEDLRTLVGCLCERSCEPATSRRRPLLGAAIRMRRMAA